MSSKTKPGLSRRPKPATQGHDLLADSFIDGAESKAPASTTGRFPWEDPALRRDVLKTFNIRLSEPVKAKLQWLSENTPKSMHQIAIEAVESEIDRQIREHTAK